MGGTTPRTPPQEESHFYCISPPKQASRRPQGAHRARGGGTPNPPPPKPSFCGGAELHPPSPPLLPCRAHSTEVGSGCRRPLSTALRGGTAGRGGAPLAHRPPPAMGLPVAVLQQGLEVRGANQLVLDVAQDDHLARAAVPDADRHQLLAGREKHPWVAQRGGQNPSSGLGWKKGPGEGSFAPL